MKKKILIASFDLAIGGVERSLIGLLNQLDYSTYDVDLMLFKHEGEFLPFLPEGPHLLDEVPQYATFRKSIYQILKEGYYPIGVSRLLARSLSSIHGKIKRIDEPGYLAIQYGWEMSTPFLPKLNKEYDVAIGFLWPHHFIGEKVKAKKKIGWIHTDYSNIYVNKKLESHMWNKLDNIVAVSNDCSKTFLNIFPSFKGKTSVIENVLSPLIIREQANLEMPTEIKKLPGKTILVTVGRFSHAKGLDYAIRACKELLDTGYDVEWYVVGYGPLEDELNKLINELNLKDRFFLLGKKINPYPYIKACDIYVQPSRYEGKAVTIREAQILGKPVVMTNFPTAKSQARDEYDALITPLSTSGIVKGIKRLVDNEDLRARLISNIRKKDYGNETEVEKLYQLIEA
ncbi:glycosyltransferase [Siminovitchia acidinfaciens]|uniref:Glycosyltransferase n=1 Tax=Siminovitchia acidinfaciens TaxID=2321395 RepID=A0A429XW20_9BACI|nr:glycosyltransferase [Siminovitchia acidinfaciens]RST72549.1 glycosyltransferase [Siminovitchia acidinfaciens]